MFEIKKSLIGISILLTCNLFASIHDYYPYNMGSTSSNYGNTGIIEVPNARFLPEASLRFNFSSSFPHEFTTLTGAPFNWLEATYRYSEIKNRRYGPSRYSGNQSLKDKGFDLKILLLNETYNFPSIALGLRDIAGTGLFSSEYIVSSKRINSFDFTVGLGWGALGTDNNYSNPFKRLGKNFSVRDDSADEGGTFAYKDWFSGRTALFGGIEYDFPSKGLKFKVEYDTTNPDERAIIDRVESRLNFGIDYLYSENLHFSSAFERGSQFRLSFRLKGNFLKDKIPKPRPKTVQRLNEKQKERILEDNAIFYRSLNLSLRDESIYLQAATLNDNSIDISIASSSFFSLTRPAGRAARIAASLAPDNIEKINIYSMNGDIEVAKLGVNKDSFIKADKNLISSTELYQSTSFESTNSSPLYKKASFQPTVKFPEFSWSMSPAIKHQIGGPEGFYLGQLLWKTDTILKFRRNLSLYTSFGVNIYDTFNDLNNPSSSSIPHVRSDIQDYLTEGKNNIQRMELQYFNTPFKDTYTRVDLGYLEEMFAGLGGEILYRPFKKKYAMGLSIHKVKQRDFNQLFGLKDYSTVTGHLGIYLDLPYQIQSQILVGKYLAGDKGVTFDLSRRFNTGFTMGIFATKTDLSSEEFGEGSFDKGFYISIPVQLLYSDFRSGNISFGLHPLTKDGGAILNKHNPLIGILGDSTLDAYSRDWSQFLR